jgi:predicted KAP-like P-loop ATPase
LQTNAIPESEFDTLLSLARNREDFEQALARLNQDQRISPFLDLLDNNKIFATIPLENIQPIVSSLLENADLFPPGICGPLSLDTHMRIHRIIRGLLKKLPHTESRFSVLQNAIAKASKSIYISVYELQEQSREHTEEADTFLPMEFRDLTTTQLDSLCKLTATRIEVWANNDSLVDHPQLLALLYAWCEWGNEEKCREFVVKMTNTDRGLIAFLVGILDKAIAQAMTKYEKNPAWEAYVQDINFFIPASSLESHAKLLFENDYFEKLREREQLALMIFLDLMKVDTKKVIPKTS